MDVGSSQIPGLHFLQGRNIPLQAGLALTDGSNLAIRHQKCLFLVPLVLFLKFLPCTCHTACLHFAEAVHGSEFFQISLHGCQTFPQEGKEHFPVFAGKILQAAILIQYAQGHINSIIRRRAVSYGTAFADGIQHHQGTCFKQLGYRGVLCIHSLPCGGFHQEFPIVRMSH